MPMDDTHGALGSGAHRFRHGTLRVTRYCLSGGRYGFRFAASPPCAQAHAGLLSHSWPRPWDFTPPRVRSQWARFTCHDHVGHVDTSVSPASTNSSGVSTCRPQHTLRVFAQRGITHVKSLRVRESCSVPLAARLLPTKPRRPSGVGFE
jgi:hypothetical protein